MPLYPSCVLQAGPWRGLFLFIYLFCQFSPIPIVSIIPQKPLQKRFLEAAGAVRVKLNWPLNPIALILLPVAAHKKLPITSDMMTYWMVIREIITDHHNHMYRPTGANEAIFNDLHGQMMPSLVKVKMPISKAEAE